MLVVLHFRKIGTEQGTVYRIFCISSVLREGLDILMLGNLKIIKCYDFWIPSEEFPYRADVERVEDLVGKYVTVRSIGGRLVEVKTHGTASKFLCKVLNEITTRPVGVRILGNQVVLAFSETLYAIGPCDDHMLDEYFFTGKITSFLVGASVKNYYRNLDKLKKISEAGLFGKKKTVLELDFVVPTIQLSIKLEQCSSVRD